MSQDKPHISSYTSHFFVLGVLLLLTAASVAVTRLEMGPFNTLVAMLIAGTKAGVVLTWFMHLKFDNKLYAIFTFLVLTIFLLVMYITFFDYSYR